MSLMQKCIFPFKTLRKWSYTNSALNQRENFEFSTPPKCSYWAEFCTIKQGNRALSHCPRFTQNPDIRVDDIIYYPTEYHINGNQWLQKDLVMCCYTATAKKYSIPKKASEVLCRQDWSVQNSHTEKDLRSNIHIVLLIFFQVCWFGVQFLQSCQATLLFFKSVPLIFYI